MQRTPSVDLNNCDREPIHIPGSIQPHGFLIACDAALNTIRRHSINASQALGLEADTLIGRQMDEIIGRTAVHNLRNVLTGSTDASRPGIIMKLSLPDSQTFDVAVHSLKGNVIVEFEPVAQESSAPPLALSRMLIARLKRFSDVEEMLKQTPRLMRAFLAYDRVMIYRFTHDGSGQVIAEAKQHDLESFLGQYFPASDIPKQARELYLKNTIRVISDASGKHVPILPTFDGSGEPLDLSFAHLRSVSPIHCEYLRNMGVAASMSISIVIGGELWGLIACHHYAPKTMSMAQRIAAEMFGEFFSLHLQAMTQKARLDASVLARRALDGLLREVVYHHDIQSFLLENAATFTDLMPCDGVGIWINGIWSGAGHTPPETEIPALARFLVSTSEGRIWATHELSSHLPGTETFSAEAAGVLAVPLSQIPRDYLIFFRKEVIQTVDWAGNPNKSYETGPLGDRLTPRKSFAIWKETVQRQSKPWTTEDRETAETIRTTLLEVIMRQTELLSAERRKADLRLKVLNEELNHRVKNILALIKSIVSQPVEERSIDEYVAALKGRIMALALAHDQVVRNDGGGNLRTLLEAELTPYGGRSADITLEGPDTGLDARAYSVMALVFHELATNAAKYGALSGGSGQLTVRWSYTAEHDCTVTWQEAGGPRVSPPMRRGFGVVLVDRSVPFDLGGESDLQFEQSGVVARFLIPAKFVSPMAPGRSKQPVKPSEPDVEHSSLLSGLSVLIVEDQLLIAMDVENILSQHGARSIDTAATSAEAISVLSRKIPSIAILDVNLGAGTSIPIAERLVKLGVPFVFATGYGDTTIIPASLAHIPLVRKPYDAQALISSLAPELARIDNKSGRT
jgi:light-regulated signal transduction histidine kinase (bacteriophytochrome)/CheY-like chemotaxis protein